MNRKILILSIGFIFYACFSHGQNKNQSFPDVKFTLLNTSNGLPTNDITYVFKDSRNLVWFGTLNNGLLRFDGKTIKAYHDKPGSNTGITSDYIGTICEDKLGWLWIESLDGLYHFDPVTEKTDLYKHDDKNRNSLSSNEKALPFIDSYGRIWITSHGGLQQFDPVKNSFINYTTPPISNTSWNYQFNNLNKILEDSKHRLWIGSAYGLYLLDIKNQRLIPYFTGSYISVTGLYEDSRQEILVSFWGGGLKKFNPDNGQYTDLFDASAIVTFVTEWEDENKKKWICFIHNYRALILFDPLTKQTKTYKHDINDPGSIKSVSINHLYKDNEGRIWICGNEGINIVEEQLQYFTNHYLYNDVDKNNSWNYGLPRALLSTNDGYFVAVHSGQGIYEYDKDWKLKKHIKCIPAQSTSTLSQEINYMERDTDGNIWYGTDSGFVKQSGNHYQCYLPHDYFPQRDYNLEARNMIKRADGLYWARFFTRGIYLFDAANGIFYKNYRNQYKGNPGTMNADNEGRLWVATANGFYRYEPQLDSFIHFTIKYADEKKQEKYNVIRHYLFDKKNNCWMVTENGLVKYTPDENKFEFIRDPAKSEGNDMLRILQDSTGTFWIKSTTGIQSYNDTEKKFRYFSSDYGLPHINEGISLFSLVDNKYIMLGRPGMITTFNPYQIAGNTKAAALFFADISIYGNRVVPLQISDVEKEIVVPPGEINIQIHVALLNYTIWQQNKLYYKLSEKDKEWIETKDGDINLYSLPPGKYLLKIKGINRDALATEANDQLSIIIVPYWYQSLIFKICCLWALAVAMYLFIKWRIKSVKTQAGLKQHITETEMAALKAQMNPHFMFNCINSIDAFIHNNDKYNATLYLNKFAKLLRNILDSSKQNTVAFTKDIETLKLYIELEELRNDNKFKTSIDIDNELLNSDYKVPPLIIQPFVENAILHGLKNKDTNDGLLEIEIKKQGDKIEYSIKDNGIGRKAAGQIMQNKESSYGMQLSYDRIRLFNKEQEASVIITDLYENDNAKGTLIKVKLKII